MTYAEVYDMIKETGIPAVYHHFPEDTLRPAPFICFHFPQSSGYIADDVNYVKVEKLDVELYTDNKDFNLEKQVEAVFRAHNVAFRRGETFIEAEKLYIEVYEMEVVIDD